jgi:hypothetical protein
MKMVEGKKERQKKFVSSIFLLCFCCRRKGLRSAKVRRKISEKVEIHLSLQN